MSLKSILGSTNSTGQQQTGANSTAVNPLQQNDIATHDSQVDKQSTTNATTRNAALTKNSEQETDRLDRSTTATQSQVALDRAAQTTGSQGASLINFMSSKNAVVDHAENQATAASVQETEAAAPTAQAQVAEAAPPPPPTASESYTDNLTQRFNREVAQADVYLDSWRRHVPAPAAAATAPSVRDIDVNSPRALSNARFIEQNALSQLAAGQIKTVPKKGPHMKAAQQCLIDLGFALPKYGADGEYGNETKTALRRFQREMSIEQSGQLDQKSMRALDQLAPPPGQKLQRHLDVDRLYKDNRLDVTMALGYAESTEWEDPNKPKPIYEVGELKTEHWNEYALHCYLQNDGYRQIRPERLSDAAKQKLGLDGQRFDPGATYFHKRYRDPKDQQFKEAVVKIITQQSAERPEDVAGMFARAVESDPVVMYGGHARYGTGPDFDDIRSGHGNFVVDLHGNRQSTRPPQALTRGLVAENVHNLNTLDGRPEYQTLFLNGCSTEEYLHSLRDSGNFMGRDVDNTDIVVSTHTGLYNSTPQQLVRYLQGITRRESMNSTLDGINDIEVKSAESLKGQQMVDQHLKELPLSLSDRAEKVTKYRQLSSTFKDELTRRSSISKDGQKTLALLGQYGRRLKALSPGDEALQNTRKQLLEIAMLSSAANYNAKDIDGDGLSDLEEAVLGRPPAVVETELSKVTDADYKQKMFTARTQFIDSGLLRNANNRYQPY